MTRPASPGLSFVTACLLFGLTAMLVASYFQNTLSTVKETGGRGIVAAKPEKTAPPLAGAGFPASPAGRKELSEQQSSEMMDLMRIIQNTPNDADALRKIGEIFISTQEWSRAEVFLGRAVLSRPKDLHTLFLLGISQYQQDKCEAAAKSFEDLLQIKEDPATMYNLAIIYKYHKGKNADAESLLRKIVASPEADAETIDKAKAEL